MNSPRFTGTFLKLILQEYLDGPYANPILSRDAAVALVTPLRDGMNLVAKEFVACQISTPPGVLIVSPFAGAGEMMHEALVCNPYEIDDAAEVIHR